MHTYIFNHSDHVWHEVNGELAEADLDEFPLYLQFRRVPSDGTHYVIPFMDGEEPDDYDKLFWRHRLLPASSLLPDGQVRLPSGQLSTPLGLLLLDRDPFFKHTNEYTNHSCFSPGDNAIIRKPVRWRISLQPDGLIRATADIIQLLGNSDFSFRPGQIISQTIYFSLQKEGCRILPVPSNSSRQSWLAPTALTAPQPPEIIPFPIAELPPPVASQLLIWLQDQAASQYGRRPELPALTPNLALLGAFLAHPYTPQFNLLGNLLPDCQLPRLAYDSYHQLLENFAFTPPKSVKRAYASHPLALNAYLLLRQLGFKDINVIQRFFHLERIGSIELRDLTWNRDEQQLHLPDDLALEQWTAFCACGIALRGENYFSHQLLYISQICWNSLQRDTLQMFYIYNTVLDDDILRHIFRDRWGKWLHDLLITAVATSNIELVEADLGRQLFYNLHYMQKRLNKPKSQFNLLFTYTPEQLALEGPCGEYSFQLPPTPKSLLALGIEMHNCVGGYIGSVLGGRSFIVRMAKGDKGVGCIEISKDTIIQAYGPCNTGFAEPERQAVLAWCSAHGLKPEAYTLAEPRKKPAAPPAPAVLSQITATLEAVTAKPQNFLQKMQKAVSNIFHKAFI